MSRGLFFSLILSFGIACSPAQSRPAPSGEPLPAALTDWLQEARNECERGGGTFRDGDYWQSGDLNGDHRPDFLITRAALGCEGNDIFSGGTAGDVYEILVSGRRGYAFAGKGILAHDAAIARHGSKTVVLTPDADDPRIKYRWEWDGAKLVIAGKSVASR